MILEGENKQKQKQQYWMHNEIKQNDAYDLHSRSGDDTSIYYINMLLYIGK